MNTLPQYSILPIVLAFALLFGGLPIVACANTQDSSPAFTLDICHPVQTIDVASAQCSLSIPMTLGVADELPERGIEAQSVFTMSTRAAEAPEIPPPKPRS